MIIRPLFFISFLLLALAFSTQAKPPVGSSAEHEKALEDYTPRTEYFTQRSVDPGQYAFEAAAQPWPPLKEILAAPGPDLPPYGIYSWADEYDLAAEEINKMGIRSIRISGPWKNRESAMRKLAENNMEVLYTLSGRSHYGDLKKIWRPAYETDEAFVEDYAKGVKMFVETYGPNGSFYKKEGLKSPLAVVEIWNEPNFQYMIPDRKPREEVEAEREALYPKVLRAGYDAVKSVAPDLAVAGFAAGGASYGDFRFIRNVHENDAQIQDYYDILTTHPYTQGAPPEAYKVKSWGKYSIAQTLANLKEALSGKLDNKPVWYTEHGWRFGQKHGGRFPTDKLTPDQIVTPDLQAAYVMRTYLLALRLGVGRVHVMHLHDTDNYNGGFMDRETLEWRPLAHATKHLTTTLPNPKLIGAIADGEDNQYIYRFQADHKQPNSEEVIVAWTVAEPKKVSIPIEGKQVTVFDLIGNERSMEVKDGQVELEIGPYPLYLKTS